MAEWRANGDYSRTWSSIAVACLRAPNSLRPRKENPQRAEQWIKEGKQVVKMTRLSCHRFRANEVRLWLSLIAYNLGNLWRRLALPKGIGSWSLTSLQRRLVKTGGRFGLMGWVDPIRPCGFAPFAERSSAR